MASTSVARPISGGEILSLTSPINRASLAYWERRRAGRSMPSRDDLDPSEMTGFLPYVFLLDVRPEPLDFRFRLIGTVMDRHMNASYTGRWMSEIPHQRAPSIIWSSCRQVVESHAPMTSDTPYVGKHKDFKRTEDVIMPLSDDDWAVNMLFVTAAFI